MSIRIRLILLVILIGVLPITVGLFWTTARMEELALRRGAEAMDAFLKAQVFDQAAANARQIEAYLAQHPDLLPTDYARLRADPQFAALSVQQLGRGGETFVFDERGVMRLHRTPALQDFDLSPLAETMPEFWGIVSGAAAGVSVQGEYDWLEAEGVWRRKFMVAVPIGGTPLYLAASQYLDESATAAEQFARDLQRVTALARQQFSLTLLVFGVFSVGLALAFGFWVSTPLRRMAVAAERLVEGEWDAIEPLPRNDEIGALSRALHTLAGRMERMLLGLENQVAERTANLETRARYLETTAEVARDAGSLMEPERLLDHVVNLISQRLGYDHTGIFLIDPEGEWAVLRAASSEGGQRMLARQHRLQVGGESIVGTVAQRAEPRIALDVGEDPVFFNNPDLPATRSEIALPLRSRGEVIGVLDVQSEAAGAFGEEDVAVLQVLADQVAVAISNARLLEQVQRAAEAERRAYGELTREAWLRLLRERPDLGAVSDAQATVLEGRIWEPQMTEAVRSGALALGDDHSLAIPIRVGGEVIGVIDGRKPQERGRWSEEEIAMMTALGEQLGAAIERARLYQESRQRAVRERMVGEVATRLRQSLDIDTILQTAIREMSEALSYARVEVRMATDAPLAVSGEAAVSDQGQEKEVGA